jgi:cytochrome c1
MVTSATADREGSQGPRSGFIVSLAAILCVALVGGGWMWRANRQSEAIALAKALTGGEPEHAPLLLRTYGCGGCHTIPGAPGADGKTAPPLEDLRQRVYIGGVARNNAENLIRWIVNPQSLSPRSAMPATGISEAEARDVAAYLYAQ